MDLRLTTVNTKFYKLFSVYILLRIIYTVLTQINEYFRRLPSAILVSNTDKHYFNVILSTMQQRLMIL